MEKPMQIFPPNVTVAFQIEFFHGPNSAFFCGFDEFFITPSTLNALLAKGAPFRVTKTHLSGAQVPLDGVVSIVLKIYSGGNLISVFDLGGENYNFLNEGLIPGDLTAKPINSRKRAREPDHAIEVSTDKSPGEDMEIGNTKRWTKKNYTNLAELHLVVENINNCNRICEVIEYECVLHTESSAMQAIILSQ